jgi:predicted permease
MNNFRFALRQLRQSPGFTVLAVMTLALGIGANASIFSVVNAVLLRPLPYPDGERLMIVQETSTKMPEISVSFPDYMDWRRDNTVFENIAIARRESYNLSGLEKRAPEQISGALVTANFFRVIGVNPQLGRVFTDEEDRVGGPQLAVISDKFWARLFQRSADVIGRTLTFGNQPFTIVGVMPPQMFSPRTVEVWFPLMRRTDDRMWQDRDNHPGLIGWGRLKPGVTLEQAQSEMNTIAGRIAQEFPQSNTGTGVSIKPLLENQIGDYRASLTLLIAAVGLVLLIACANLANLLAARGAAREREFAVRVAIGATRGQIVRQLLVESLLLAAMGGTLGLCLAAWGRDLIIAIAPAGVPRFQNISLDAWVIAFTAGLVVLFGLWPALHIARTDAQTALKSGGYSGSDAPASRRSRDLLVIIEIALTLVLLSAAGLVLKSFAGTISLPLGFDPRGVLTARVDLPSPTYEDGKKTLQFATAVLEKMRSLPGAEHVAIASCPPLMAGWQNNFLREGLPEPPPGQRPSTDVTVVFGDYFETMKTAVLRGRAFNSRDTNESENVVMIDQRIADKHFANEDPIGKRIDIRTDAATTGAQMRTIIGVVQHVKLYGFEDATDLPQLYFPYTQVSPTGLVLLLRSSVSQQTFEQPLRQIVASIDPAQPVFEFRTMQDRVAETWATPRLMSVLLGCFAILALTLAVVGVYGVMTYNGQRRTREMGVRLALGATPMQVASLLLRHGARLLLFGTIAGIAGALATSRLLRSMLVTVSPVDPPIYFAVTALLAVSALLACLIPARRASRVNPMIALRAE